MKRLLAAIASFALLSSPVHAFKLIKDDEARLPAAAAASADRPVPVTRAITRGPGIRQLAPEPDGEPVKSPLSLKLTFEPRGGSKIDPASIRVTYLKANPVDLSERVRHGVSEQGIELAGAEVPPGQHEIQVTVQDSEGRKGTHVLRLKIAK